MLQLNILVRKANAYALSTWGFQCKTNGTFMMVHALINAKTSFKMPLKSNVINLFNNKVYKNTDTIPIDAQAGSTYWFLLEPAQ